MSSMETTTEGGGRRTSVRWRIVILAGIGVAITNVDRSAISVALPFMTEDLHISPLMQGLVLGWFFLAYSVVLLPAGFIVDKLGVRLVYGVGAIVWGLATVGTALVQGVVSLLTFRLLLGIGEASQYPSCIKATSEWFPDRERTAATGVWDIGARVGGVLTVPLVAGIIAVAGWRMAFVVVGALAVLWAVGWLVEYRRPEHHPRADQAERDYIAGDRRPFAASGADVRWRDLFTFRATWGLMLGYFCFNYVAYFFITWFPSYLVDARGFDLLKLGLFGAIPGIVAVLSELGSGFLQDRLIARGMSTNRVRKGFLVVGMLISSVIAFAVLAPTATIALVLLTVSYGALLIGGPSLGTLPSEFAPSEQHIGSLAGIQNCAGNLAGFLGPIITGAIYTVTGSFVPALVLTGAVAVAGAITYLVVVPNIPRRVRQDDTTVVTTD